MGGILIGEKHTERDWGLMWVDLEISPADLMTYTFEVPGKNGIIDITEGMGGVKYRNRTLSFDFVRKDISISNWHTLYSQIANYCHGKVMSVILDSDRGFYWTGRVTVQDKKQDQIHSSVSITVDADPYKYETLDSTDEWLWSPFNFRISVIRRYENLTVNGTLTTDIIGAAQEVVPVLVCSKAMTLTFEGITYSLVSGENKNYGIVLKNGLNRMNFTCSGSGTISILFRGCSL